MRLIQFILIPLLLVLIVTYLMRLRSKLFDRIIVFFLGTASILMVSFPDVTQYFANLVGVGRGTDLITYFGLVGLSFISILQYDKIRQLETKITDVARGEAIKKAEPPHTA